MKILSLILVASALISAPVMAAPAKAHQPSLLESLPQAKVFIEEMENQHHFDPEALKQVFSSIKVNNIVLRAIRPPALGSKQRSWKVYWNNFFHPQRLDRGLSFWKKYHPELSRAEKEYGVPAEIIVSIIGIETNYGQQMGKFSALEALATLAFAYPPRADFFKKELESLLLIARAENVSPLSYQSSYAGALGIPQFMPSSLINYAVDFDGDGHINLKDSPVDAIGSVARFLSLHGWKTGEAIAWPVTIQSDPAPLLSEGIKPLRLATDMLTQGIALEITINPKDPQLQKPAALIDLPTPEAPTLYWLGFDNFYVITRYNRSNFYAMSVFLFADMLREKRIKP